MNDIQTAFEKILKLKKWFSIFAKLDKRFEAEKIWARWIITHRSLQKQKHFFLPTIGTDNDLQIISELVLKGSTVNHAKNHYNALLQQCAEICKHEHGHEPKMVDLDLDFDSENSSVIFGVKDSKFLFKLPAPVYDKLLKMHHFCQHGLSGMSDQHIWHMFSMYHLLDGVSLQWAVPRNVFKYIHNEFGCDTEIFASPINAYYRNYYSLFEIDKMFNSKGNFFTAPLTEFKSGCYQINPPFIDIIFTETSLRVLRLLEIADRDSMNLTFIYIMPDWRNLDGYEMLSGSKYCNSILTLRAGNHYYYNAQKQCYIKVHFNTKVLVMSTDPTICPAFKLKKIAGYFTNPHWQPV